MALEQVSISPGKVGTAEVRVDIPTPWDRLEGRCHGQPLTKPQYTRLFVGGQLFMTDAEFELETNELFVSKAKGDVLIAGLGIGLILAPVISKDTVKSVTVIENNLDVINLVYPQYDSPKLGIVNQDIFFFKPARGQKFDTIYFDIWPNICSDYCLEITKLKSRFRTDLAKDGWMGAWCEREMKRQR
jgi:hypothetical protein